MLRRSSLLSTATGTITSLVVVVVFLQQYAMKCANFNIQRGEKVLFLGKTGSGKSTLIDLLMGLLKPTSGSIKINKNDLNIGSASTSLRNQWMNTFSHVPQNIYINDSTIAENIAFGIPVSEINFERVNGKIYPR